MKKKNDFYKLIEVYVTDTITTKFLYTYTINPVKLMFNLININIFYSANHPRHNKNEYRIYLVKRFSQRLSNIINHINDKLIQITLRIYFTRLKSCYLLWMYCPKFYFLHNYAKWKYLIFDYELTSATCVNYYHFYNQVFSKKLIFLYSNETLQYFHKDRKENYITTIKEKIGRLKD